MKARTENSAARVRKMVVRLHPRHDGEPVDPNASGVTYAVKISSIEDGTGVCFHPGCPPAVVGYKPVQLPGADLTTP